MTISIEQRERFEDRHIGPSESETSQMLNKIGVSSLEELINQTVPGSIRLKKKMNIPAAMGEYEFLKAFKAIAAKNKVFKSYIGLGYYNTITPNVILRNILENPGWYTAYTPYQAEIAQGRLEALINYQTMVADLTGMEIANASLLDEATAAAEAMHMFFSLRKGQRKDAGKFFVSNQCLPQTIDVLITRSEPIGIEVVVGDPVSFDFADKDFFGVLLQYPGADGEVVNYSNLVATFKEQELFVTFAADLLSLVLLTPPGEMGADAVVGITQRFGVPMGYGGPHAAYFATREEFKRHLPGRIIGASLDAEGKPAYRMALQTREQHIRREKATSNICTAQVLLAVIAGSYAVYHGKEGLKNIALRVHGLTRLLEKGINQLGFTNDNKVYFDTLKIALPGPKDKEMIRTLSENSAINFRYFDTNHLGVSLDETTSYQDVKLIVEILANALGKPQIDLVAYKDSVSSGIPQALARKSDFLTHPVFNTHHSEHEMLRYLKLLENKDLSMVHSMISLGSCTMKLNATAEMIPVTWPEFGQIHPFAPVSQAEGYMQMFEELSHWLAESTGFAGASLQPNSGAQGEYAGLLVIRAYHHSRGDHRRNVTLIPSSAHGTNPASAVMAGMEVVVIKSDEKGNIDLADLKEKAQLHKDKLSALMVTYPSTHGIFEEGIIEVCRIIHENGGRVYMDGANMNAQVGLTSPAAIGADVCHLNLHKTFCIPHGGGGPGMGPICVVEDLVPFLPGHVFVKTGGEKATHAVSAAPFGSASILTISYAYIAMMGEEGLTNATRYAILNANYMKARLEKHFPVLYAGAKGCVAHEMILDCRSFKAFGVEVEDIAKRLMDYGFHAPTVSFPVAGTLMIEPTESESLAELNRFCDAMISIRAEIAEIEQGKADRENNVLKNAPHTAQVVMNDGWDRPYSREKAAYPMAYLRTYKFWPGVSRIDSAYGDRNLMCTCLPVEEYADNEVVTA